MTRNTRAVSSPFGDKDKAQIKGLGMSLERVLEQLHLFRDPPPPIILDRPCVLGDGIRALADADRERFFSLAEEAARQGRFMAFVPASGASSRMFKPLISVLDKNGEPTLKDLERQAQSSDQDAAETLRFIQNLAKFPFYSYLQNGMEKQGVRIESEVQQGHIKKILETLLMESGLAYASLPKALLPFHRYDQEIRTALEEHLMTSASYLLNSKSHVRLHLTISPAHRKSFAVFIKEKLPDYEKKLDCKFILEFSFQRESTNTLAVDLSNSPFRSKDDRLLFRPGGHGALIENLNDLKGDVVFIRNVDNVARDDRRQEVVRWEKILGGCLLEIERQVHSHVRQLKGSPSAAGVKEAADFTLREFLIGTPNSLKSSPEGMRQFILSKLERPLRVCGVVKAAGEP